MATWSNSIKVSRNPPISLSGIIFGPSEGALSGSGCVSTVGGAPLSSNGASVPRYFPASQLSLLFPSLHPSPFSYSPFTLPPPFKSSSYSLPAGSIQNWYKSAPCHLSRYAKSSVLTYYILSPIAVSRETLRIAFIWQPKGQVEGLRECAVALSAIKLAEESRQLRSERQVGMV